MGSSAKKKREKKKDFQKAKLKVGKTRAKASNFTDTSFKSKAINLQQQSLKVSAPTQDAQLAHHLSLLQSHSDVQCRDSLAYLTNFIAGKPAIHQPWVTILPRLPPLIARLSPSLRAQLMKLFRALPAREVRDHIDLFTRHIRAGMTSLSPEIRMDTVEVLSWLLDTAGRELVSSPGGWSKLLKCFLALFGWDQAGVARSGSSNPASLGSKAFGDKGMAKQLQVFAQFIRQGLTISPSEHQFGTEVDFPLWHTAHHVLPEQSYCFIQLDLFGTFQEGELDICESPADRQRLLLPYKLVVMQGLDIARREGGELGRAAAIVKKIIQDSIASYTEDG